MRHAWLLVISVVVALGMTAYAQLDGTMPVPSTTQMVNTTDYINIGIVKPTFTFENAIFATGGVGLRNLPGGAIEISGVVAPIQAAYIYWAVITQGPPNFDQSGISVTRLLPEPVSVPKVLWGEKVGIGPAPCWAGDRITVFRAVIPTSIAAGNGLYKVVLRKGAQARMDGADPWAAPGKPPMFEGASIVVVGTGTGTVAIYDKGLAGKTWASGWLAYRLGLPIATSATPHTILDVIGADGQTGMSRDSYLAGEKTTVNDVLIAGPGSKHNDSDWNGSAGLSLPQLWDNVGHDISEATPLGTTFLNVGMMSSGDCLTTVANVVEVH